jgi:type I restriction enzyme M protein
VRGKYRDVILPMTVLRRFDAVLEPTKQTVLEMKAFLDKEGIVDQDGPLRDAADQAVYNTSKFTLRDLQSRTSQQQLRLDFEAYSTASRRTCRKSLTRSSSATRSPSCQGPTRSGL